MTGPVQNMNERTQLLLKMLVERYIHDGQPVGSRTLSRESELNLSPATIRNVMADLEDMGLIIAPHTSAGRIPTAQGYRVFVDSLVTVKPLRGAAIEKLKSQLGNGDINRAELINKASDLLSSMTRMAGIVSIPKKERIILRHIEFLPLSANRVLVILVVNQKDVQNRIIHTDRSFTPAELLETANYLNREFAGKDMSAIREGLLQSMQQVRDDMQHIMQMAIRMADTVMEQTRQEDCVIAGQTNLMDYAEMASMDKLRQLFTAFNTKRDILHILDQSINAQGTQVFIGEESGYSMFDDCSVITTPYKVNNEIVGVLGVIGPTRMAYDRVIPVVDVTAKLLGSLLSSE